MKTGFINAYCHKPAKKYYSYHGIIRDCLIEPDPDPFDEYPTLPPYGPEIQITCNSIQVIGYEGYGKPYSFVHGMGSCNSWGAGIGQEYQPGPKFYLLSRMGTIFDTTLVPIEAKIVKARLRARASRDYSYTDFDIVIRNGMPIYPHEGVDPGDYYYGHYSGNGGSVNTGTGIYYIIHLNETGLEWINKGGLTKFFLTSSRDIAGIEPTGKEVVFYGSGTPKQWLTITYKLPL